MLCQTLLQAVEEAKQVAAHRKDHYVETAAFDVLDRATWKHAAELGALELPTEPSEEDVRLVRQAALSWLCQVAAHPQHTYEVCPMQAAMEVCPILLASSDVLTLLAMHSSAFPIIHINRGSHGMEPWPQMVVHTDSCLPTC
jgi:hypothetical protein